MRTGCSLGTAAWMVLAAALLCATAACGKKRPPLAPFARVPAGVGAITPQRVADDVYLSFTVPDTNADGQKPASLTSLEVYAVTSEQPPRTEDQREVATLVATLPVRPVLPPVPVPANASAPPPIPLPPGVDQGAGAVVMETLTPEARVAVELPADEDEVQPEVPIVEAEPFGPIVPPAAARLPRRHYFVIGYSARGRKSTPSTPVSVSLEPPTSAPGKPEVTHLLGEMMITWSPPPDARTATFLLPPAVKPGLGANITPASITPKAPTPMAPLQGKPFGFGFDSQPTRYHVFDVTPLPVVENAPPPDPFAIKAPAPITPAPVLDPWVVIKGVAFGVERCFHVRAVDQLSGTTVMGPPSPTTCVTPQDTFPPAAPRNLAAIAGAGVISLIWDPNTESDLAGYVVLRGEAPGETLQAITTEPITVTSYRDETVKPGIRYVYAVVAVDKAVPQNVSPQSNRAEETARQ
ncbi:MAG TPA: hypothetical protein VEA16_17810 [Vicinamibacterales bacterium]|nr:hypothetical protein [Vicinamibacterales bacterium]